MTSQQEVDITYRIWRPREGRGVHVMAMTDRHLLNTRDWLDRGNGRQVHELFVTNGYADPNSWRKIWLALIDIEIGRRGICRDD